MPFSRNRTRVDDVQDGVRLRIVLVPDGAQARLATQIPEYEGRLVRLQDSHTGSNVCFAASRACLL